MGKRQIIIKGTDVKPSHIGEEVNIEDKALKLADIKRVFMERVTAY